MSSSLTESKQSITKGFIWSLTGYLIFSSHDAIVKLLSDYSVFQIIFFGMLFGFVPFSIARVNDPNPVSLKPKNPGLVLARAILSVGSLGFAFSAFTLLPMVQVYVLLFLTPLLVSILAIPMLGERIHLVRWVAIIMGLAGIVIVLRPSPDTLRIGHLFGLLAACCSALAVVITRKISRVENYATMIVFPLIATIIVSGIIMIFVYQPMQLKDLLLMFSIGVLGLTAQYSLLQAYRNAPAASVAPMQYSQLIWALIFGVLFFNETIDTAVILGSLITISSGIIIIWRETKYSQTQPTLRTRNMRGAAAPHVIPSESEEV